MTLSLVAHSAFLVGATMSIACVGEVGEPGNAPPIVAPVPTTSSFASASGARRLTTHELDNSVRDLLGDDRRQASVMLTADEFVPFDNDYTGQQASEALINSIEFFATDVAAHVVGDAALRERLVPCTPSGAGDAECFRTFIEDFAPKAFRRPVTAEEVTAYMTLQAFSTEIVEGVDNDFFTGVELVLRAILQDPEFLYRIEVGEPIAREGVRALDAYEIATRLSYFLWGSTPDEALLAEAASGALETSDGRRTAATRMLADDRARSQIRRFHTMWLGYRVLPHSAELVGNFAMETGALIDRVVFADPQSYLNLFNFQETYLNTDLANHYGLPEPEDGEGWVPYGESGRAGILSHGTILSSFAKFADTSPTQRGILIRTRLMCQDIPPPPPDVDVDAEPDGETEDACKYERYAAHRDASSGCSGCHALMDPIGFGLENYDMAGRYRDTDEGRPDCIIEGEGTLPGGGGTFSGPAELGQFLIDDGYVESCAIQQLYGFAIGREATGVEEGAVRELVEDFREEGHDLAAFITSFVASDRFAHRREEAL